MKTKILVSLMMIVVFAACTKDKYTTRPQIKFKKQSTSTLNHNDVVTFTMEVTDAEGDLQDTMWIQKVEPKCGGSNFTAKYKMPDFTAIKNIKADVDVCFAYGNNLGCPVISGPACPNRNDTATFRFWIKDKGGNISDTATSSTIVILK
jgi:hypothetical protein